MLLRFQKALDSGEFLTENSLDSILSYCLMKENVRKPFFLYGCFRGSRPANHKSAESSVVLFPICICFKNQRIDSDKDTEGIASYYIKYPHCTHSDSLCQGSWFPQESSELLSQIKQHSQIPLITKLADAQNLLDSEGNQILSETVFLQFI